MIELNWPCRQAGRPDQHAVYLSRCLWGEHYPSSEQKLAAKFKNYKVHFFFFFDPKHDVTFDVFRSQLQSLCYAGRSNSSWFMMTMQFYVNRSSLSLSLCLSFTFGRMKFHFGWTKDHFGSMKWHFGRMMCHFGQMNLNFGWVKYHFGRNKWHFGRMKFHFGWTKDHFGQMKYHFGQKKRYFGRKKWHFGRMKYHFGGIKCHFVVFRQSERKRFFGCSSPAQSVQMWSLPPGSVTRFGDFWKFSATFWAFNWNKPISVARFGKIRYTIYSSQCYKASTIVIYKSRVVNMRNFLLTMTLES